jgi:hypothetical protein
MAAVLPADEQGAVETTFFGRLLHFSDLKKGNKKFIYLIGRAMAMALRTHLLRL